MRVGEQVEVYSAFADTWARGFEIAAVVEKGYRVRRLSDRSVLPGFTSESDLRQLHRGDLASNPGNPRRA